MLSPLKIAVRYKPYDHLPGLKCLLPGTPFAIQVFPAFLRIFDLAHEEEKSVLEVKLDIQGPVEDFCFGADLENSSIRVWGHDTNGYFRYRIEASMGHIAFILEKAVKGSLELTISNLKGDSWSATALPKGLPLKLVEYENSAKRQMERLSLGSHRAQDMMMIRRRADLADILPLWYAFAQQSPKISCADRKEGNARLLGHCEDAVTERAILQLPSHLMNLFSAFFKDLFVPQWKDTFHLGLIPPSGENSLQCSPLGLLHESYLLIRSLFVDIKDREVNLLPSVPKEFHAGRFLQVTCGTWGILDIEWSKKTLKRVYFNALQDGPLILRYDNHIPLCRLRRQRRDRGVLIENGGKIDVCAGDTLLFDRFGKTD